MHIQQDENLIGTKAYKRELPHRLQAILGTVRAAANCQNSTSSQNPVGTQTCKWHLTLYL